MLYNFYRHSRRWFTLVELILGMTIFAIGLTAILALLGSTIMNSSYSRHEIVVAGILREQIELVKNIRDTNLLNHTDWDKVFTWGATSSSWTRWIYTIENNFQHPEFSFDTSPVGIPWSIGSSPIKLENITAMITPDITTNWAATRLYFDEQWRYTHIPTATGTSYASYIIVSPLGHTGATWVFYPVLRDGKNQWYIIDARVIIKNWNNYREYDAKTAITDWVK